MAKVFIHSEKTEDENEGKELAKNGTGIVLKGKALDSNPISVPNAITDYRRGIREFADWIKNY